MKEKLNGIVKYQKDYSESLQPERAREGGGREGGRGGRRGRERD